MLIDHFNISHRITEDGETGTGIVLVREADGHFRTKSEAILIPESEIEDGGVYRCEAVTKNGRILVRGSIKAYVEHWTQAPHGNVKGIIAARFSDFRPDPQALEDLAAKARRSATVLKESLETLSAMGWDVPGLGPSLSNIKITKTLTL